MHLGNHLDRAFSVPFCLRLRFTDDVLGDESGALFDLLEGRSGTAARVQVWVDENLAAARSDLPSRIERLFESNDRVTLSRPPELLVGGEACKNDARHIDRILRAIHEDELDRRSYVVVIGGGAVLDAVGFAAAVAHRGIRLVRLPTTTLAQCDSGVGVKNAVNLFGKKNWKGSFAVPWAVINDAALLATLPDRDFVAGFSEVVKVSLLKKPALFEFVSASAERLRGRDPEVVGRTLCESVILHLDHITQGGDPFENLEARPLDFGHWVAHRLEALTDYALRHGEAVAIGLAVDCLYSERVLGLSSSCREEILGCLRRLGLPTEHRMLAQTDALLQGLEEFRQHLGGQLTITLLEGLGRPVEVHEVDFAAMRAALEGLAAS